jgi:hypothetical protein
MLSDVKSILVTNNFRVVVELIVGQIASLQANTVKLLVVAYVEILIVELIFAFGNFLDNVNGHLLIVELMFEPNLDLFDHEFPMNNKQVTF